VFNSTTIIRGAVFPEGTSSILFFGRQGLGPWCYGPGTATQNLVGTLGSGGQNYCYDPTSDATGPHAPPYAYQVWAYNAADLAAAKSGTKQPWEVVPSATWNFELPFEHPSRLLGGVAYDPATQRIFVASAAAEAYGMPMIHVFKVGGTSTQSSGSQNTTLKVNAGLDQTMTVPAIVRLNGFVTYEGRPNGTLNLNWSQISGPDTVGFSDPKSAKATAQFRVPGSYVLRLNATDGVASASDDISILINPEPVPVPTNIEIATDGKIKISRCKNDKCIEHIQVRKNTNITINGAQQ
jgi:hypothetical protein